MLEVNRRACSCKCSCVLLPQRSISLRFAYVQFLTKCSDSDYSISSMAQKRTHHFRGLSQYSEQLMDLAEGRRVFEGRGQQPRNKDVLKQIAAIKACKKGSFLARTGPALVAGTTELLPGRRPGKRQHQVNKDVASKQKYIHK